MRPLLFLLTSLSLSCGGMVEEAPQAKPSRVRAQAVYLDATCAARPAAVATPGAAEVVTEEAGWHFDGSDPKVRVFDGGRPSVARRYYVRDDSHPAACRPVELGPTLVIYDVELR